MEYFERAQAKYVVVDANVENDLRDLNGEDKHSFRQEYGVFDDGVKFDTKSVYTMRLSNFTVNEWASEGREFVAKMERDNG